MLPSSRVYHLLKVEVAAADAKLCLDKIEA